MKTTPTSCSSIISAKSSHSHEGLPCRARVSIHSGPGALCFLFLSSSANFEEEKYQVVEGPTARIWDEEYKRFFEEAGIATKTGTTLYTSVHYILKPNRKTPITCELQVRTLLEEVWGEVDHEINYPRESKILACREQLAALARATWSCNRLIDAIYRTKEEAEGL